MIGISVIPLPYRILAGAVALAAIAGGSFAGGVHVEKASAALHEQAAVSKALAENAKIKAAADAQAQAAAKAQADLASSLANAQEQLRMANRAHPAPAACNLSNDQMKALDAIYDQ